jgi:hypothetical protein
MKRRTFLSSLSVLAMGAAAALANRDHVDARAMDIQEAQRILFSA